MAIGYKLNWKKALFKNSEVFECEEFPAVFTWVEKDLQYVRIGEKLYATSGNVTVDFKKAEGFIVKTFKEVIEGFEKRAPHENSGAREDDLLKELETLNLLVQCMFK